MVSLRRIATSTVSHPATRSRRWSAAIALLCWMGLVLAGRIWLMALQGDGHELNFEDAAPFIGRLEWHPSFRLLPAVAVAVLTVAGAAHVVSRMGWRPLLAVAAAWSALWAMAVAVVDHDGWGALTRPLLADDQYLAELDRAASLGEFVSTFAERATTYVAHVSSHPPGMVMVHALMDRVGLGGAGWAAALTIGVAALSVPAAMLVVREVSGESTARRAAPFLAVTPTTIWIATTADALFMGVGALAVCAVVLGTGRVGRRSDALALAGGVGFGMLAFFSYGLPLLALVPTAIALDRRRVRPLVLAALGAGAVFVAFAVAGFWWLDGLHAAHEAFYGGVGGRRPRAVFVFVNWAILAAALGPALAVGVARCRERGLWLLAGGALVAMALASLSGYSKGEVERIWLPFTPWLLVLLAVLSRPWRAGRAWLALQAGYTIVVTTVLLTPW